MKVEIVRIYDVSKHYEGCAETKQLLGRTITCRLIYANDNEKTIILETGAEVLASTVLDTLKTQQSLKRSSIELRVDRFKALVKKAKKAGVPVELEYLPEILVGYADSPEESHSEGSYILETGKITGLSKEGMRAIISIVAELAKL